MALVDRLYTLQRLDTLLNRLREERVRLRDLLNNREEIEGYRRRLEEMRARVKDLHRQLLESDAQVQQLRKKLQDLEARLARGQVRNPREALVLQQEIAYLYRKIDQAEDLALQALMEWERSKADLEAAEAEFQQMEAQRARLEAELQREIEELEANMQELLERRRVLMGGLPPEIMAQYEQLRARKGGLAVALVEDGACSACGAVLSAARLQAARNVFSLTYCPQCGRILYAP